MSERQESREAFILHTCPYRETSLLLEVFTRAFGRMSMVARGARRPRSAMRGVLLSFQPLALGWFGVLPLRRLSDESGPPDPRRNAESFEAITRALAKGRAILRKSSRITWRRFR